MVIGITTSLYIQKMALASFLPILLYLRSLAAMLRVAELDNFVPIDQHKFSIFLMDPITITARDSSASSWQSAPPTTSSSGLTLAAWGRHPMPTVKMQVNCMT